MDKKTYLEELNKNLLSLSTEEREEAIKYYEEYFEEAGEENVNTVISDLGSPEKLASNILKEYNIRSENNEKVNYEILSTNIKENTKNVKSDKNIIVTILIIIMLVIGFLIFFPVLISLLITLISIAIAIFSVAIALLITGIVLLGISGSLIVGNIFSAMLVGGTGLITLALGLVISVLIIKALIKCIPWSARFLVNLFKKGIKVAGGEY